MPQTDNEPKRKGRIPRLTPEEREEHKKLSIKKFKLEHPDYYHEHKIGFDKAQKKYINKTRDRINERAREWKNKNPDRVRGYRQKEKERQIRLAKERGEVIINE